MIYSIDVECVATGVEHNARSVAQISLVVRSLTSFLRFLYLFLFGNCVKLRSSKLSAGPG
jgi:hypothetical protein